MPELPEVETIRRELNAELPGRRIEELQVHRTSVVHGKPQALVQGLTGRRFGPVERLGKYLLFSFDQGPELMAHLGMSGKFVLAPTDAERRVHDRVRFLLDQGRQLIFSELRCFGFLELLAEGRNHPRLNKLGQDAYSGSYDVKSLKEAWAESTRPIKTLLLEQSPLAGIGNIYAAEILFAAQIHPETPGRRLGPKRLARLITETKAILELALSHNGTSISDFRRVDDKTGGFQNFLKVYGKENQPCPTCGGAVKRIVTAQRSSFFCPRCQRK
ncbi:MAG: bifunctional DNA-formamidopyrimidine glycosylase/DNA-(apurinic or apyrimidinic site) lyase [bacterium]|nr:bifunctional DNA-formamidopyrimidine glycosylase/DNA-(apurinic or apyrimidinic site) lyase [bacterium]